MKILEGKNLSKSYEGKEIISDIDVNLSEGEMVSLLGISGIGKTTLFNLLSGLEAPDCGQVYYEGKTITGKSGLLGYMQQADLLLPFKTISQNVIIPLLLKGETKTSALSKAKPLLKEFGLSGHENSYPAQLSGGMRQRAALLRSFLFSSKVLLMDEPFSALDAITRKSMQLWFKEIAHSHGLSTFFITHDINEALLLSDRIYILSGNPGKITHEIKVEIPDTENAELTNEFLHEKKRITDLIK